MLDTPVRVWSLGCPISTVSQPTPCPQQTETVGNGPAHTCSKRTRWGTVQLNPANLCFCLAQEEEALDVLRILSKALAACPLLKSLNLSDNALGEKGIRACAEVLTSLVSTRVLPATCKRDCRASRPAIRRSAGNVRRA